VFGKPGFILDECLVDEQLGRSRGQLHGSPFLNLLLRGPKFRCVRSTPIAMLSSREKCFECFAKTAK
jgi:hypothetical protein